MLTLSEMSIERNFLLSPMSIQFETSGNASLTSFSMGTGATFSPPAVISNSVK